MKRYRFYSNAPDYRPVSVEPFLDNKLPWWCTGYTGDLEYAIIVAYLPDGVKLKDLWPEAENITAEEVAEVAYTSRFPKPSWCE